MKTYIKTSLRFAGNLDWVTLLLLSALCTGFIGLANAQKAAAAQTASDYCNQYEQNSQKNACRDGLNGTDCANYVDAGFGQETADICTKAAKDAAAGIVTPSQFSIPASPSPSPSPSQSPPPSNTGSGAEQTQIQNLLDQADSLSQYIDILHSTGPDADTDTTEEADNNYGSYVNGAGKQQEIKVLHPGSGSSPAILFFNGGGWHTNDQAGQNLAGMETPLYDNTGAEKASDRGYAMFDVTYRLGSSGVYYMFEDVMRGIQHMRNNAGMYGIDPNKIVIWGDSAGGSLSMRAAASGKSGAKAAVGWSAPTNAYTALFHSFFSFAIGMDHSTCIPTDLAGFANFADLAAGGSGDVAEYGQGLSSNDVTALGINLDGTTGTLDPLALLTQGLIAGQNVLSTAQDVEAISSQITSGGGVSSLTGSAFNMATTKFIECLDNFNVLSPALFASPDTPPSFLAEFEEDNLVDADQAYGMRDKLRQLGIKSEALVLPISDDCKKNAADMGGGCHLGYYKDFVCKTLNFIDSVVQPERGETDCATGVAENQGNAEVANADAGGDGSSSTGGGESSSGSSGGGGESSGGSNSGTGKQQSSDSPQSSSQNAQQRCESNGGQYLGTRGNVTDVCNYEIPAMCDTWESTCNGGNSLSAPCQAGYTRVNGSCARPA